MNGVKVNTYTLSEIKRSLKANIECTKIYLDATITDLKFNNAKF